MTPVRILGIGSPFGDDQAGWLAIKALECSGRLDRLPPGHVSVVALDRPGMSLINYLNGAALAIIIDALRGSGPCGMIRRFDSAAWPEDSGAVSSHAFGVFSALALARELGCLPPKLVLYGIEVAQSFPGPRHCAASLTGVPFRSRRNGRDVTPEVPLSPEVAAAIPILIQRIGAELFATMPGAMCG